VSLPPGYREGVLTAITVFIAFSLGFLKYYSLETPGRWTWLGVVTVTPMAIGLLLQLIALFRALDVRDDAVERYRRTIRYFLWGVVAIIVGVVLSIVIDAT
jgi:hypothetical protein